MVVLGIDTSCDDTSVALLEDGRKIVANVVSSQVDLHRLFGGVVPEIASRKHVELIDRIYEEALVEAGLSGHDLDALCVTNGPGLIGSVLAGLCFAKGLALALDKPLVAVNHIHAHALSILLEKEVPFPFAALVVSGGHTLILLVEDPYTFKVLGSTRDDAAGEAFDKAAKFLGLGYPGGRVIEDMASRGDREAIPFPRPMIDDINYDFSFSGLKTALINYMKKTGVSIYNLETILASFQEAVCDVLAAKTFRAARDHRVSRVVVGGGVASNGRLREVFGATGETMGIDVFFSSPHLCTDNGAMVALAGYFLAKKGLHAPLNVGGFSRMALR